VEADVAHKQGKPVSVFIKSADCKFPMVLPNANSIIAVSKWDIQTKLTIARFTHSPLDILSVEADVAHKQGKPVSVFIKSRTL